jgi:hypothetical protein
LLFGNMCCVLATDAATGAAAMADRTQFDWISASGIWNHSKNAAKQRFQGVEQVEHPETHRERAPMMTDDCLATATAPHATTAADLAAPDALVLDRPANPRQRNQLLLDRIRSGDKAAATEMMRPTYGWSTASSGT